jgi:hypothetical protein
MFLKILSYFGYCELCSIDSTPLLEKSTQCLYTEMCDMSDEDFYNLRSLISMAHDTRKANVEYIKEKEKDALSK